MPGRQVAQHGLGKAIVRAGVAAFASDAKHDFPLAFSWLG